MKIWFLFMISILVLEPAFAGYEANIRSDYETRSKPAMALGAGILATGGGAAASTYFLAGPILAALGVGAGVGTFVATGVAGFGAPLVLVPIGYGAYKLYKKYKVNLMGVSSEEKKQAAKDIATLLGRLSPEEFRRQFGFDKQLRKDYGKMFDQLYDARVNDLLKTRLDRICGNKTIDEEGRERADLNQTSLTQRKTDLFNSITGKNSLTAISEDKALAMDENFSTQAFPYAKGFPHTLVIELVCVSAPKDPSKMSDTLREVLRANTVEVIQPPLPEPHGRSNWKSNLALGAATVATAGGAYLGYKLYKKYRVNLMGVSSEEKEDLNSHVSGLLGLMSEQEYQQRFGVPKSNKKEFTRIFHEQVKSKTERLLKNKLDAVCKSKPEGLGVDLTATLRTERKTNLFSSVTGSRYLNAVDEHGGERKFPYRHGFSHTLVTELACLERDPQANHFSQTLGALPRDGGSLAERELPAVWQSNYKPVLAPAADPEMAGRKLRGSAAAF